MPWFDRRHYLTTTAGSARARGCGVHGAVFSWAKSWAKSVRNGTFGILCDLGFITASCVSSFWREIIRLFGWISTACLSSHAARLSCGLQLDCGGGFSRRHRAVSAVLRKDGCKLDNPVWILPAVLWKKIAKQKKRDFSLYWIQNMTLNSIDVFNNSYQFHHRRICILKIPEKNELSYLRFRDKEKTATHNLPNEKVIAFVIA